MTWVKLRCIMGCPGLKSSSQEKGILQTMGAFLFRKLSADFGRFRVFVFSLKAYSKTQKPRKI